MRFVTISSVVVGSLMIIQWIFFIATGNVPELSTTPVSIIFHISIEVITAGCLIVSGLLLRRSPAAFWGSCYAQGMLGYTVINSSGYFAQLGQWVFLLMFSLVLAVSLTNLVMLSRSGLWREEALRKGS